MKKTVALIMALILAVAVFAGCNSNVSTSDRKTVNSNCEEAVDIMIRLLAGKELSQSQVRRMQPDDYVSYMEDQGNDFSDYYESVQKQRKTNENAMIAAFGKDYTLTYEIIEDKQLNDDEQYQATKHLHSEQWYDAKKLNDVRSLSLEISVSGEKNSKTFDAVLQAIQYGSAWHILQVECDEMESFLN